jgi:hypothetical protein
VVAVALVLELLPEPFLWCKIFGYPPAVVPIMASTNFLFRVFFWPDAERKR